MHRLLAKCKRRSKRKSKRNNEPDRRKISRTARVASAAHPATKGARVLLYCIVLRLVYPMFRGTYFTEADAISENIPTCTNNRPDWRMMCALIRMNCISQTWIDCINEDEDEATDLECLRQVQSMLMRKDGSHNTESPLYRQAVLGQRHLFNGQLTKNGSVAGALNTKGNEPKNPPLAKALSKVQRMEYIRPKSVFSWVSGFFTPPLPNVLTSLLHIPPFLFLTYVAKQIRLLCVPCSSHMSWECPQCSIPNAGQRRHGLWL
jgi:hypothetical protein